MSTATAEPDRLVSAPPKTITFVSRREDLKLVLIPERADRNREGDVVATIPGMRLKFDGGTLRIPPSGMVRGEKGETLDAADVLARLEGDGQRLPHHLLGDRLEGFWRLDEPAPVVTEDEMSALNDLGMRRDATGLQTFIAQEEAGWARPALLGSAQKLLDQVRELLASEAPVEAPKAPEASKAGKPQAKGE